MQKSYRFVVSVLLLGAFLLSACSGAMPTPGNDNGAPGANSNEVLDNSANSNDANTNDANANGNVNANSNDDSSNVNGNSNDDNSNANGNSNDDNSNTAPSGPEQEIVGAVQAITKESITINGVTYKLASFTEFKGTIVLGDQVKIHVIVNADGTFTIREIEKTTGAGTDNSNSNSNTNSNSNDDNSNSNSNSNDDNSNGDDNSNDDNSNDDNDNDSNSNG